MIEPRDSFVAESRDTLAGLCNYCLDQVRKDVWARVQDEEYVFFRESQSEILKNAEKFQRQYEIILPDLIPKKMEKEVKAVAEGYEVRVKIPFTRTKAITNAIFICQPLSRLRRIDYVNFDREFNDDYTGTSAPKYMEIHLTVPESDPDEFQRLLDDRIAKVEEILNSARETIKTYNDKIEAVFLDEFEKRKEKIRKSKNFVRQIKATDKAVLKNKIQESQAPPPPSKKSGKLFYVIIISIIIIQTLALLYFLGTNPNPIWARFAG